MKPFEPVVLAGRHVRLEPRAPAHVPALLRASTAGSRESFVWTTVPPDESAMMAYVESALADQREGKAVPFATDARNARSRAAIERLGAHLDGELRGHMPAADDTVRTSAVYSLLADEWPEAKSRLTRALAR